MLSRKKDFLFDANFNFGVDNLFVVMYEEGGATPPETFYLITENGLNYIVTEDGQKIIQE